LLFHHWIRRIEDETYTREPWKTLSDGIKQTWIKALVSLAMYGGFIAAWIAKK
jgi:hypothetical protein